MEKIVPRRNSVPHVRQNAKPTGNEIMFSARVAIDRRARDAIATPMDKLIYAFVAGISRHAEYFKVIDTENATYPPSMGYANAMVSILMDHEAGIRQAFRCILDKHWDAAGQKGLLSEKNEGTINANMIVEAVKADFDKLAENLGRKADQVIEGIGDARSGEEVLKIFEGLNSWIYDAVNEIRMSHIEMDASEAVLNTSAKQTVRKRE